MFQFLAHPKIISLSALKASSAMNWLGGGAPLPLMLVFPLTYWSVHCKCTLMQKQRQIYIFIFDQLLLFCKFISFSTVTLDSDILVVLTVVFIEGAVVALVQASLFSGTDDVIKDDVLCSNKWTSFHSFRLVRLKFSWLNSLFAYYFQIFFSKSRIPKCRSYIFVFKMRSFN